MVAIALAALAATIAGVVAEHRSPQAPRLARGTLRLMLYGLIPFVSFVNIAHLRITLAGGVGIAFGWVVVTLAGGFAWALGRRWLRLRDRRLGAVMVSSVLANTGYLGTPVIAALLGDRALRSGIAYDQLVSAPALFTLGFGIGAVYGDAGADAGEPAAVNRTRLRAFIVRNPPLLAVIAGLLVPARLAPAPLPEISHRVVDAMLVLGFFAAGVILAAEREADYVPLLELPSRPVLVVLVARLLVAPLALLALSGAVVAVPRAYLIQAFMPTGLNALVVGEAYGLDQRLIATAVIWGTAIVMIVALGLGVT